ncbi:MAG: SigB/SigF/SigG family RNA polymerase sigma factor [Angustibacter sp.]
MGVSEALPDVTTSADALEELHRLPADDPRRAPLRDAIVRAHLPLVQYLAGRYRHLGEPLDDLVQVGTIGLINAVDRFDASRGTTLATYATPTIVGEIKRYFRDRVWSVRVPRRLQELHAKLGIARATLAQELGRQPTVREIAERLGVDEEDALEALEALHTSSTVPLTDESGDQAPVAALDQALEDVVERESLRPLLHRLPEREKRILALRFFRGLSQREIADELGISQMHVSRLLARTVDDLRRGVDDTRP